VTDAGVRVRSGAISGRGGAGGGAHGAFRSQWHHPARLHPCRCVLAALSLTLCKSLTSPSEVHGSNDVAGGPCKHRDVQLPGAGGGLEVAQRAVDGVAGVQSQYDGIHAACPHASACMRRRPPYRELRDDDTTAALKRWAFVEWQGECNVASAGVVEADGAPERLEQRVGRACSAIAAHVRAVSPHQYDLRRMRLAFKQGPGVRSPRKQPAIRGPHQTH
jgi:hypothetical protein